MKKTFLITLMILVILLGFITLRFGNALIQEGNPIPVLNSIITLELTNSKYEQFSEGNNEKRYVSKNTNNSRTELVKEFMKERNWNFKEQMGSGLVFQKDNEIVTIVTKLFSRHYFLWDVPEKVFK